VISLRGSYHCQCALVSLLHLLEHFGCKDFQIVAVDLLEARRQKAQNIVNQIGSINGVVKCPSPEEAKELVRDWTEGSGCNAIIEVRSNSPEVLELIHGSQVVGYTPALTLAYELIRPFGVIASIGYHQTENLPFTVSHRSL
jgi:threonine dehydrogenase-like Zn-dependent dehydrogenase